MGFIGAPCEKFSTLKVFITECYEGKRERGKGSVMPGITRLTAGLPDARDPSRKVTRGNHRREQRRKNLTVSVQLPPISYIHWSVVCISTFVIHTHNKSMETRSQILWYDISSYSKSGGKTQPRSDSHRGCLKEKWRQQRDR